MHSGQLPGYPASHGCIRLPFHFSQLLFTWQGKFPVKDTGDDGYAGIAPVKRVTPNSYGLRDMAGNIWE